MSDCLCDCDNPANICQSLGKSTSRSLSSSWQSLTSHYLLKTLALPAWRRKCCFFFYSQAYATADPPIFELLVSVHHFNWWVAVFSWWACCYRDCSCMYCWAMTCHTLSPLLGFSRRLRVLPTSDGWSWTSWNRRLCWKTRLKIFWIWTASTYSFKLINLT